MAVTVAVTLADARAVGQRVVVRRAVLVRRGTVVVDEPAADHRVHMPQEVQPLSEVAAQREGDEQERRDRRRSASRSQGFGSGAHRARRLGRFAEWDKHGHGRGGFRRRSTASLAVATPPSPSTATGRPSSPVHA